MRTFNTVIIDALDNHQIDRADSAARLRTAIEVGPIIAKALFGDGS